MTTTQSTPATDPNTGSVWTVFGHYLGGDAIHVQATPEVAARFLTDHLDIDLDDECGCEFGCGPIWWPVEGPNDDGTYPTQPPPLEDTLGSRVDPADRRTRVYTADQVTAALG